MKDKTDHKIICNEIDQNTKGNYPLGTYLYLGMAYKKEEKVCIAVGYTLNYCLKRVDIFLTLDSTLKFSHVSKIKVGEKQACKKFYPEKHLKQYYL